MSSCGHGLASRVGVWQAAKATNKTNPMRQYLFTPAKVRKNNQKKT